MINRRKMILSSAAVFGFVVMGVLEVTAGQRKVFASSANIAINGYDPVAYFTNKAAIKGSEKHTAQWNGAIWQFSNEENKNKFSASPQKYAPQYGGYCAFCG